MAGVDWLIVLNPNEVVELVEGAPIEWVGKRLTEIPQTSGALRRAARELAGVTSSTAYVRRRSVAAIDGDTKISVELVMVEALPLRRAPTSVHELVMRTLDLFASQATSNEIDMTIEQASAVPRIVVDSEKIAWAISTLIANALRYARKHVRARIQTDDETGDLLIMVSEDGPGIPKEKLPWLFERDPTSGHTAGVALPMVRDVMVAHRGSVSVQSSAATGTSFTLRIPITED